VSRVAVSGRIGLLSSLVLMILSCDSHSRSCGAVGFKASMSIKSYKLPKDHATEVSVINTFTTLLLVSHLSFLMGRVGGASVAG